MKERSDALKKQQHQHLAVLPLLRGFQICFNGIDSFGQSNMLRCRNIQLAFHPGVLCVNLAYGLDDPGEHLLLCFR